MGVLEAYKVAKDHNLNHVIAYLIQKEGAQPSVAEDQVEEYRKYLAIAAGHGIPQQIRLPISQAVDAAWHAHMLHSRDYQLMCERLGAGFIHHQPVLDVDERKAMAPAYAATLDVYQRFFGQPPKKLWGDASQVCDYNGGCYC